MNIVWKTILTSCIVLYSTNNTCIAATDATDADVNVPNIIDITPQTYTCDTDLSAGSSEDQKVLCNSDKGLGNYSCDDDQVVTGFSYTSESVCSSGCDWGALGCVCHHDEYSCYMTCTDFDASCDWEDASSISTSGVNVTAAVEDATEDLIDSIESLSDWSW
jgi:hypothetical protein